MPRRAGKHESPGRPRSREADDAILAAALELLIEYGASAVSIEQIARRAGVTRATVYRRFKDKNELMAASLASLAGSVSHTEKYDDIEKMIAAWSEFISQPRMRVLLRRLYASLDEAPQLPNVFRTAVEEPFRLARLELLEAARVDGRLRYPTNPALLLEILSGVIWHHLAEYPDDSSAESIEAYLMAVLAQAGYAVVPSGTDAMEMSPGHAGQ